MLTPKQLPTLSVALALCSLAFGAIGCDDTNVCTLRGCSENQLRLAKDTWVPGEYELEVAYSLAGDVSFRCTFETNDAADRDAGADAGETPAEPSCVQLTGTQRSLRMSVESEAPFLHMWDSPESLQLTLRSADETLFEDTISPEYTESFPNGPGCGSCFTVSTSIEIP